jgi:hypothetical protein
LGIDDREASVVHKSHDASSAIIMFTGVMSSICMCAYVCVFHKSIRVYHYIYLAQREWNTRHKSRRIISRLLSLQKRILSILSPGDIKLYRFHQVLHKGLLHFLVILMHLCQKFISCPPSIRYRVLSYPAPHTSETPTVDVLLNHNRTTTLNPIQPCQFSLHRLGLLLHHELHKLIILTQR